MSEHSTQTTTKQFPPMSWFALFKQHVYLSRFAFTLFVPLMSAATVSPKTLPEFSTLLVIVLVAWGFHMTFYGMNDVTDYELDKILGRKDDHPLVRGEMSRRTALIITLIHTASVFIIEFLSGTTIRLILLLIVACGGVIIYDVYSKKNSFPPLTDAIESIGFVALALYGAEKVGAPGPLAYILAITFGVFMNFITGSFLGIVDVKGDLKGGALTTPIWFGTRPLENSQNAFIPKTLTIFGLLQIAALVILNLLPLLRNDFNYSQPFLNIITSINIIVSLAMFTYITRFLVHGVTWQRAPQDIDLDLLAAYSVLILAISYFAYLSTAWIITLAIAVATPLFVSKLLK
ncbi:MAG: UbiA family prenyltransferase [Anaerolineales bacterium]|nr:UbiA family prenyltransferase [Anaerolineales bacterium]